MKQRILLVDDEPQVRELFSLFLSKHGYEVSSVASSAETLAWLEKKRADLAILDIGLAEEDGLRLLPILKSEHPKMKVIMLTGMGFVEDLLEEAQQKGADGYVSKALPLDELLEAIARVLQPNTVPKHSAAQI